MIAHVVLFTPKSDLSEADSRSFAQSIVEVFRQIPVIERAIVGRAVYVKAGYQRNFGDKTYEFAAVVEFKDAAALLEYLNHPLHKELGALFWRHCESTVIVDIESADATSSAAVDLLLSGRSSAS